jgi:hypothetical protein
VTSLEQLKARKELMGEERMRQVGQEWAGLHAAVRAALESGLDPADPKAQTLARKWFGLLKEFTGGDPGIARSLGAVYQNEDRIQGMDVAAMRPMMEYVGKAAAAGIRMPGGEVGQG